MKINFILSFLEFLYRELLRTKHIKRNSPIVLKKESFAILFSQIDTFFYGISNQLIKHFIKWDQHLNILLM